MRELRKLMEAMGLPPENRSQSQYEYEQQGNTGGGGLYGYHPNTGWGQRQYDEQQREIYERGMQQITSTPNIELGSPDHGITQVFVLLFGDDWEIIKGEIARLERAQRA